TVVAFVGQRNSVHEGFGVECAPAVNRNLARRGQVRIRAARAGRGGDADFELRQLENVAAIERQRIHALPSHDVAERTGSGVQTCWLRGDDVDRLLHVARRERDVEIERLSDFELQARLAISFETGGLRVKRVETRLDEGERETPAFVG